MTVVPGSLSLRRFSAPRVAAGGREWLRCLADGAGAALAGTLLWLAVGLWLALYPALAPALVNQRAPGPALDDFGVFYAAARMVRDGRGDEIYDIDAIVREEARVYGRSVEQTPVLPYFNPPAFAGALVPLTWLPPGVAASVFLALTTCALAAGLALLWKRSRLGIPGAWVAGGMLAAFQPVRDTLFHGQPSFLLFFAFATSFVAFASRRERLAGALLGLLLLKPNYALVPLAVLLWKRRWAALGGFVSVATVWFAISIAASGFSSIWTYPAFLWRAASWDNANGISIAGMFGWNGVVRTLLGPGQHDAVNAWSAALAIPTLALVAVAFAGPWDTRGRAFAARYGAIVLASVLVNPHVYRQDVVVAAVPALLLLGAT
ncbi:MAG TPA: glycosyltransferase family 87 protein, partial [Dehalococcoidia bacterium]|nr:glycosyltransferase family 87 protein [Dehalococcoidia bacterium]